MSQLDDEVHQADVILPPGLTQHHGPAAQLRQQRLDGAQSVLVNQGWKEEAGNWLNPDDHAVSLNWFQKSIVCSS